jgi:hypothetical protein
MNRPDRGLVVGLAALALAFFLWYGVFLLPAGGFWVRIAAAATLLAAISLLGMGAARRPLFRWQAWHPAAGAGAALALYLVFLLGKTVLTTLFPTAREAIASVYAPRTGFPLWLIAALLVLVTGPAEEIFWRGLLQRVLAARLGPAGGLLLASSCYALVHIWTVNLPLILAALVAGLAWGALFQRSASLWPVILSHSLWSLAIFVLFPVVPA